MFLAMNLRPARWTTVKWPVLNEWQPYNTELSMKFKSPAVGIRVFALFFAESSQSKNRKSKTRKSHSSSRATGGMMCIAGWCHPFLPQPGRRRNIPVSAACRIKMAGTSPHFLRKSGAVFPDHCPIAVASARLPYLAIHRYNPSLKRLTTSAMRSVCRPR